MWIGEFLLKSAANHVPELFLNTFAAAKIIVFIKLSMKKVLLLLFGVGLLRLFSIPANGQTTGWSWVRTSSNGGTGNAIAHDRWGNVYVTGTFETLTINFGNTLIYSYGSTDVFLAKYDAQGNLKWVHSAGENGPDEGSGIAVDNSGNAFITGTFSGSKMMFDSVTVTGVGSTSFFIAKYDSSGTIQWARSSDGGNLYSEGRTVAVDESGNSYIAGTYIGTGFSIGTIKLPLVEHFVGTFVAKYDANGNVIWAQWIDGPGVDQPYAITTDNAGTLYLTGTSTSGGISFSDGYILESPLQGYNFPFLIQLTATSGSRVRATSLKGYAAGTGICLDASGNIYLTGYLFGDTIRMGNTTVTGGPGNAFIARYTNSGSAVWALGTTGGDMAFGPAIGAGADGNLYLAGQFSGGTLQIGSATLTNNGIGSNSNMFAASVDTNGNLLWALSAGGDSTEALYGITTGDSGQAYVCGTAGSPFFKAGNIDVNCSGQDIFTAKLGTPAAPAAGISEVAVSPLINIYPNPNNGNFEVILPSYTSEVEVLNLMGQVMQTHLINAEQQLSLHIPTSGLYFVRVTAGGEGITQKIIVTQ